MPLSVINKVHAADQDAVIDAFKDCAVAAGWTLHDTSATGYCLSSQGESGNHYPIYLHMHKSSTNIMFYGYLDWNLTTHVGLGGTLGHSTYTLVATNGASPTYIWASINKDSFVVSTYAGTPRHCYSNYFITDSIIELPALGILQSDVAAGSSVVLQLAAGEADRFIAGNNYQIVGPSGVTANRNYVEVSAVDTTLHRLTITTLTYAFKATSRIGHDPFPWKCIGQRTTTTTPGIFMFPFITNGAGAATGSTSIGFYPIPYPWNYVNPDLRSGKFILQPSLIIDTAGTTVIGIMTSNTTFLKVYIDTSSEHTVAVGEHDFGTSSGSNTGTTLNDTTKSWTINEFADKVLMITAGTGQGQFRKIASNTATEITITAAFTTTPDATSQYSIADEGWLYLYIGAINTNAGCLRMM